MFDRACSDPLRRNLQAHDPHDTGMRCTPPPPSSSSSPAGPREARPNTLRGTERSAASASDPIVRPTSLPRSGPPRAPRRRRAGSAWRRSSPGRRVADVRGPPARAGRDRRPPDPAEPGPAPGRRGRRARLRRACEPSIPGIFTHRPSSERRSQRAPAPSARRPTRTSPGGDRRGATPRSPFAGAASRAAQRPPVRTDPDQQIVVVTSELEVVAVGERQTPGELVHRAAPGDRSGAPSWSIAAGSRSPYSRRRMTASGRRRRAPRRPARPGGPEAARNPPRSWPGARREAASRWRTRGRSPRRAAAGSRRPRRPRTRRARGTCRSDELPR